MPAKSEAQRRFIYGVKGKAFAKRHHFDNKGKLPERVRKESFADKLASALAVIEADAPGLVTCRSSRQVS